MPGGWQGAPDLLEALQVLAQLGVQRAAGQLREPPVPEVLLPAVASAQTGIRKSIDNTSSAGQRPTRPDGVMRRREGIATAHAAKQPRCKFQTC